MALSVVDQINFITTNDPMDLKNLKTLITIFKESEIDNFKIVLNNSRDPFKNYFSMYDIKHILNHNINYTLSSEMFLKDMEKRIMNGEIVSLDKKFASVEILRYINQDNIKLKIYSDEKQNIIKVEM